MVGWERKDFFESGVVIFRFCFFLRHLQILGSAIQLCDLGWISGGAIWFALNIDYAMVTCAPVNYYYYHHHYAVTTVLKSLIRLLFYDLLQYMCNNPCLIPPLFSRALVRITYAPFANARGVVEISIQSHLFLTLHWIRTFILFGIYF